MLWIKKEFSSAKEKDKFISLADLLRPDVFMNTVCYYVENEDTLKEHDKLIKKIKKIIKKEREEAIEELIEVYTDMCYEQRTTPSEKLIEKIRQ